MRLPLLLLALAVSCAAPEREPPTSKPYLLPLPDEVRRELNARVEPLSSSVAGIEKRAYAADRILDSARRGAEYDKLREEVVLLADAIDAVRLDPKYADFRNDPQYSVSWNASFKGLTACGNLLRTLKKKSDLARADAAAGAK